MRGCSDAEREKNWTKNFAKISCAGGMGNSQQNYQYILLENCSRFKSRSVDNTRFWGSSMNAKLQTATLIRGPSFTTLHISFICCLTSKRRFTSKDFVDWSPFPLILGQVPGAVISQICPVWELFGWKKKPRYQGFAGEGEMGRICGNPFIGCLQLLLLPSDATGFNDWAQWELFEAGSPIGLKGSIRCILGLGILRGLFRRGPDGG